MKKFCSKCGNRLDLGKRTCTICSAFNPYFIAGFASSEDNETGSNISEKQANGQVLEQPLVKNDYAADLVRLRREQLEYQKNEFELKNELLKVKEETQQYKKETFELVTEVKKELQDIENENRLLKEKVESLKSSATTQQVELTPSAVTPAEHKTESKKGMVILAVSVLFIVVAAASWFFFNHTTKNPQVNTAGVIPIGNNPDLNSTENRNLSPRPAKTETAPAKKLLAVAGVASAAKPVPSVPAPVAQPVKKSAPEAFSLTESKLKADLIGKKLSGCDITINNAGEINSISNLVLVDRLSASYLKYKCIVKIKQGNEAYISSPYIYYSAEGSFIKVDGTNCE
jgi:hypothetical protein